MFFKIVAVMEWDMLDWSKKYYWFSIFLVFNDLLLFLGQWLDVSSTSNTSSGVYVFWAEWVGHGEQNEIESSTGKNDVIKRLGKYEMFEVSYTT